MIGGLIADGQNQRLDSYTVFIDSAYHHLDANPDVAFSFLDSIPKPVEKNIEGHISCYYDAMARIYDKKHNQALCYQNFALALKYAKIEENFNVAGGTALELFYNTYIIKKDTSAYAYLRQAKKYYELAENKKGLAEVLQMPAIVAFHEHEYSHSNDILFEHLEEFKRITDDAYYYMYALYLITLNSIRSDDSVNAYKYFNRFNALRGNPTIPESLYKNHAVVLYGGWARHHLSKKNIDSTLFYLKASAKMRENMNASARQNYYSLYIDYFDQQNDHVSKNRYKDSLALFKDEELKETLLATAQMGDHILHSGNELQMERSQKKTWLKWFVVLLFSSFALVLAYFVKLRRQKSVNQIHQENKQDYTFLKLNHEKLKAKFEGMEVYISSIKKDIKIIALIKDLNEQQNRIKELYRNVHLNSSVLLEKGEDHLGLINELNMEFFKTISNRHPELNSSEKIVCYYLFMGFKSKEIGAFINTSTRAIESKRYRISSKLNLKEKDISLKDYLVATFG
ncbi:hypothetical protein H7U19_04275 [Hyunsoonleella sp. SJ7]|uniref:HTH luxR-type domain-containing protein n=1 Tax=Hyunsoonleella aquatilis TaxID=2762758 RepID=A0A923HDU5_9FLAO|nr:hypothetical protein [Hyunsoonleella aquatilis]MBC3757605.1 hypothetical protein [Hyunsoonleella aquatilis]